MRSSRIDTLRGLACILLVAYHVIGSTPESGLRLASGIYRELNDFLTVIRMPLFTFLSGWVYSLRPFSGGLQSYLTGKARRLLLPMLTVGTLFAILQTLTPGANSDAINWKTIHIVPVAHFWFVEAIFTIFVIVSILEICKILTNAAGFSLCLAASSLIFLLKIYQPIFALSGSLYLLPFFLLGMMKTRYLGEALNENIYKSILLVAFTTSLIIYLSNEAIDIVNNRSLQGLLLSFSSCLILQSLNFKSSFLTLIGKYSYSIFIFHVFFTAFTRIFLTKLSTVSLEILFLLCTFAGLVGPIIVELVLDRNDLTRTLFLGKKLYLRNSKSAYPS